MKIETKFDLGDTVFAKPLEIKGEVMSVSFGRDGMSYKVRYVSGSEFKYEWFFEDELEEKLKKSVGFND